MNEIHITHTYLFKMIKILLLLNLIGLHYITPEAIKVIRYVKYSKDIKSLVD